MQPGSRTFFLLASLLGLAALLFFGSRSPAAEPAPVPVTYFFNPGCRECDEIKALLGRAGEDWGIAVRVELVDLSEGKNIELLWGWEEKTGKKAEPLLGLVVGNEFLAGYEETRGRLRTVLEDYAAGRAPRAGSSPPAAPPRSVEGEFSRFGPGTVALAGLVDGINPCAFTVLVMLLSFMMVGGISRGYALGAGLAFAAAVFSAYLLVGFGLFSAARAAQGYRTAADVVYLAVGALSVVLGGISIRDAVVVRRTGELGAARLRLPPALLGRIQRTIGRGLNPRHLIVSAFLIGLVVSLLELACTGQIYFPTIVLIMKNSALRARGFAYLLLYCGAFILPLLVVLGAVFGGSRIPRVAEAVGKFAWLAKGLAGLIFLALGIFLLVRF